jgi:hypothetical protein
MKSLKGSMLEPVLAGVGLAVVGPTAIGLGIGLAARSVWHPHLSWPEAILVIVVMWRSTGCSARAWERRRSS